jgi:hypothetical protein
MSFIESWSVQQIEKEVIKEQHTLASCYESKEKAKLWTCVDLNFGGPVPPSSTKKKRRRKEYMT